MIDFGSSYIPQISPGLVHREKESLHLFLHPEKPRWAVTNPLGWEIIRLCDGKSSIGSIAAAIGKTFEQDPAQVEKDVAAFIRSFDKANLLLHDSGKTSESASAPVKIKGVFLHFTSRCNLKCIHCYAAGNVGDEKGLSGKKVHNLIDELAGMNGRAITFSGGEPLLRKDWYEVLEHAVEQLRVTLNTNATLIDVKTAALLSNIDPSSVQISLDGPTPEIHDSIRGKGSFDSSVRGIRTLQDAGLGDKVIISMTLMKQNIASAPEMISLAEQLGVPKLRFLPLHSQGRARSSWATLDASVDDYLKWFDYVYYDPAATSTSLEISGGLTGFLLHMPADEDEIWCGIGSRVVIDHTGNVYPCALLMDNDFNLGNVNQVSLEEIERSSKLTALTSACVSRRNNIEECSKCTWKGLCQSACPALIFLEKGSLWATDDYCKLRKKLFEDMIFEVAKAKKDHSRPAA